MDLITVFNKTIFLTNFIVSYLLIQIEVTCMDTTLVTQIKKEGDVNTLLFYALFFFI